MAGNNIYSMSNVIMFRRILGLSAVALGLAISAPALAQGVAAEYKLHAGDKIEISVWKEPDLQRSVNVRPDGRFSFPLTGDVVAAGRSVEEVRGDIENRLKKYIPEPVVTVTAVETGGNRVYVIGQVARPFDSSEAIAANHNGNAALGVGSDFAFGPDATKIGDLLF